MKTFARKPKATQQTRSIKSTMTNRSHFRQNREVDSILHAQRTIGNQAVLRLLQANGGEREDSQPTSTLSCYAHDSSRIPLHAKVRAEIQPKLTVNIPGDICEQEADRVAVQVMHMPEPRVQRLVDQDVEEEVQTIQNKPLFGQATPFVQRQVVPERKEEEEAIKAEQVPGRFFGVTPRLAAQIQSLRGGGQPLHAATRAFFEPRFGLDFSQVRVHTDAQAIETARALNAHAFTVGRDVVFGSGKYAPETLQGKRLLGHELTHVVQQNGRHEQPAKLHATPHEWGRKHTSTSLVTHVEMKAGSEVPSESIGISAVPLGETVTRGLGSSVVARSNGKRCDFADRHPLDFVALAVRYVLKRFYKIPNPSATNVYQQLGQRTYKTKFLINGRAYWFEVHWSDPAVELVADVHGLSAPYNMATFGPYTCTKRSVSFQ